MQCMEMSRTQEGGRNASLQSPRYIRAKSDCGIENGGVKERAPPLALGPWSCQQPEQPPNKKPRH